MPPAIAKIWLGFFWATATIHLKFLFRSRLLIEKKYSFFFNLYFLIAQSSAIIFSKCCQPLGITFVFFEFIPRCFTISFFEKSDTVAGIAYGYGPQERMPRDSFVIPKKFEFEGLNLNGPSCYDYYLKALYGEYIELPSDDKRQVHYIKVYDLLT